MKRHRTAAGLLCIVVGAWACDGGGMVAGMMDDAGALLIDAGDAMRDASEQIDDAAGNDASAEPPLTMELPCDVVAEETRRVAGLGAGEVNEFRATYRYAELRSDTIVPSEIASATALGCGYTTVGASTHCTPAAGVECEGYAPLDDLSCRTFEVQIDPGIARVHCGSSQSTRRCVDGTCNDWQPGSAWGATSMRVTLVSTNP